MKIETPQILWHNGSEGNGTPAPLYSVSFLPTIASNTKSACVSDSATKSSEPLNANANINATASTIDNTDTEILATAGNSNEVHIWKLKLSACQNGNGNDGDKSKEQEPPAKKPRIFSVSSPGIHHITTLTRHERSINAVSFSHRGTHLASAGDGGTLIVHTVPNSHRHRDTTATATKSADVNNNINTPTLFWKTLFQSEKDLSIKIVHTGAEDVMDISWSRDERRFIIGTLDHSVLVFEEQLVKNGGASTSTSTVTGTSNDMDTHGQGNFSTIISKWNCVWKNNKEHTHYVQGVSYDPLGVYLASQGSDRSVRVWQRKGPKNAVSGSGPGSVALSGPSSSSSTKKVLSTVDENINSAAPNARTSDAVTTTTFINNDNATTDSNATLDAALERHLRGKFEVGKAKVIKYRSTISNSDDQGQTQEQNDNTTSSTPTSTSTTPATNTTSQVKKRHLFADESTVESFFRRLAWTTDGAFLVTPASLWHTNTMRNDHDENNGNDNSASATAVASTSPPSFATYLFARHQFDKPYKVLHGLEKPSVVIRPNPNLFNLPSQAKTNSKENLGDGNGSTSSANLSYRSVFAVLTGDSILIYDTYHSRPLCIARGLHYAGLTDCSWTSDGKHLVVCSTDGYISIVSFEDGELGEVYIDSRSSMHNTMCNSVGDIETVPNAIVNVSKGNEKTKLATNHVTLPPCEPGTTALVAPPTKKARTMEISSTAPTQVKAIVNVLDVRKKKRVTPTVLEAAATPSPPTDENENNQNCVQQLGENSLQNTEKGGCTSKKDVVGGVTKLSLSNQQLQQPLC